LFYSHAECQQLLLDVPLVNDSGGGRYERVGLDRFGVDVDVHNDNTYGPMVLMLMLILMLLMLMVVVHDDIMIIVRQSCACFFPDIVAVGQGVMSEHFPRVY